MINSTTKKKQGAFLTSGRGLSLSLKSHSRSCQKHKFPPLPSQKHIYVFTVLCSYLLAQQKRVIKSMATAVKENTKYNLIPANSSQNNSNAFFSICASPPLFWLDLEGVGATVNPNARVWQPFLHRRVGSDLAALRGSSCCISDHTCAKGGSNITTGLHIVTRVGVVGRSRG